LEIFMMAIFKILDLVPGWVYALALAATLAWCGVTTVQLATARSERDGVRVTLAETNTRVQENKTRAAQVLAKVLQDNIDEAARLHKFIKQLETDRDTAQAKNAADVRAAVAGQRLQFTTTQACGRGGSGDSAAVAARGPAPDASATARVVELPEAINANLLGLAGYAQSLAIDYRALYTYVHDPQLVCERRGAP
jgi:hypothetical protein